MRDPAPISVPLAVDLDGTLIKTDTLLESILRLARRRPLDLARVPGWLLKGRPYLKHRLAERGVVDVMTLPLTEDFVEFLRAEHARGRHIVLATAAHKSIADGMAERMGFFHRVLSTDGDVNLAGHRKADALREAYGDKAFDYAGNEHRDLRVWKHARAAIVVNASARLARKAAGVTRVDGRFGSTEGRWKHLLRAIRPHQWLKNLLIFVPVFTAHAVADVTVLRSGAIAFLAFCLVTSGVYLFNDLLDLEADRRHPTKHRRPLAAGDLAITLAALCAPAFFLAGLGVGLLLPPGFAVVLAAYVIVTSLYSLIAKRVQLLDVFLLAGLYMVRIVAGHEATGLPYSFWLLLFALFFFLGLAILKRYAELVLFGEGDAIVAQGRGYRYEQRMLLASFGIASGFLSVLVFALYVNSPDVVRLYRHPVLLFLLCPFLLYWICRMWFLGYRGAIRDDPIIVAVKDLGTYVLAVAAVLIMLLAT